MVICPVCGAEIPDDSTFCPHCNTEFMTEEYDENYESSALICPICSAEIAPDTEVCPYCGTEFETDNEAEYETATEADGIDSAAALQETKFCSSCGNAISLDTLSCPYCSKTFTPEVKEKSKKPDVKIIAIIAAVIIIIGSVSAVFLAQRNKAEDKNNSASASESSASSKENSTGETTEPSSKTTTTTKKSTTKATTKKRKVPTSELVASFGEIIGADGPEAAGYLVDVTGDGQVELIIDIDNSLTFYTYEEGYVKTLGAAYLGGDAHTLGIKKKGNAVYCLTWSYPYEEYSVQYIQGSLYKIEYKNSSINSSMVRNVDIPYGTSYYLKDDNLCDIDLLPFYGEDSKSMRIIIDQGNEYYTKQLMDSYYGGM